MLLRARHWRAGCAALALWACGSSSSAPGAPSTDVELAPSGALPACDPTSCAASAAPCQLARCEEGTGVCRASAAPEGEPCLPGNACGPARCRSGRCEAESPPSCQELVDDCHTAACDPQHGCLARAREPRGSRCDRANPLEPRGVSSSSGSNACGQPARGLSGCWQGSTGPASYFELDLRAAAAAVPVRLVIDAGFAFEAALSRGPCDDPALVQCAEPEYVDGRARAIETTLLPDRYQLIVQPASASDRGPVHVAASVAEPSCAQPPSNDACGAALALDAAQASQSVLGSSACATADVAVYCAPAAAPDVFYQLDLSDRASETLLEVELAQDVASLFAAAGPGATASSCGELLLCGQGFSRRLAPGVYRLGVSRGALSSSPLFSLALGTSPADCSGTRNTSWQTALELDPALARQRIQGNTACGDNQLASACNDDRGAPELYYRLDLRGQSSVRRVHLEGTNRASGLLAYVLHPSEPAGASPSAVTACRVPSGLDHWLSESAFLAPRLYYLVIDGVVRSQGRFDLELSQSDPPYARPAACVNDGLDTCLLDTEPACSLSRAAPACLAAAVECGLQSEIYAAFCAEQPGCCDESEDRELCAASWEAVAGCD